MDNRLGLDSYKKYKTELKNELRKFCSQLPKESKNVIKKKNTFYIEKVIEILEKCCEI